MSTFAFAGYRRFAGIGILSLAAWTLFGPAATLRAEEPPAESATEEKADNAANEKKDVAKDAEAAKSDANGKAKSADAEKSDATKSDAKPAAAEAKNGTAESKPAPAAKPATQTSAKPAAKAAEAKLAVPKKRKVRLAQFIVKNSLPEATEQSGVFGELHLDLAETISRIDKAANDTSISGAVLNIENPEIGRAKIYELRAAIQRFRAKGKKMYAQVESAMPADYLVASACDEIVMPESGMVMLPGVHAEATFYKNLLEKLGIRADFIHMGAYKGAAEPLTREEFSEPVRENMTSLIDSLYDDMVTTIVKDRPLSVSQAKEVIDRGLLTATQAKEAGLIDRIAYPDTLRDDLAKTYDAQPLVYVRNYGQKKVDTDFSGPMGLIKLMQAVVGGDSSRRRDSGKKVAVVYAVGPIMTGKSQSDPFGSEVMGSTTIVEALRKANDDKDVAAIVLRIDSPGGSALASDLIWHETQVIKKPIVASMGDVAASGGYYIAMGTDKILAAPGTVTGSIGVVGGKLSIRGLYKKIGITTETISRGRNSGLFASSGRFTDSQREVITSMMEDTYRQFTTKASEGRKMPHEKLVKLAGGRVYTGRQALANGLVDQLGSLDDAIVEAKLLAGIEKDAKVKIERLPEPTNFFESLFGGLDAEEEVELGTALEPIAPELVDVAKKAYRLRAVFDRPAAVVMPFELEIR
jgi:protease-4